MGEDLTVAIALCGHHGGANLAKAHAVAPAGSAETESAVGLFHYESR